MTTMTLPAPGSTNYLLPALQREWDTATAHGRPSPAWQTDPVLACYHSPGQVVDAIAAAGSDRDRTDQILHALLTHAADGDELAGRTVLQALMPKLWSLQWWARRRHVLAPEEATVEAMWMTIQTYPLHRRQRVSGNLSLDCLKRMKLTKAQETADAEQVTAFDDMTSAGSSAFDESAQDPAGRDMDVVTLLTWALESGALTQDQVRVLALRHLAADTSWSHVAKELGTSPGTARKRGERAQRTLVTAAREYLQLA